jgi:hypothetical protein
MAGIDSANQFPNSKMAQAARLGQSRFRSVDSASVSGSVAVGAGNDATVYTPPLRTLYVGTTGNIAVVTPQGVTVTYNAVPAGTTLQVDAATVKATGTTASNIVGGY